MICGKREVAQKQISSEKGWFAFVRPYVAVNRQEKMSCGLRGILV